MSDLMQLSYLFDFYGELLTPKRRKIYAEYIEEDFTITEIANRHGVSRQNIHESIRYCEHILQEYEKSLKLVEKFQAMRKHLEQMENIVATLTISEEERERLTAQMAYLREQM